MHNLVPELLYSDASLLVVNKPAGLLAVPGRGADKQDCLSVRIQQQYPDALVVHRLDMATSGLMVFARGLEMQRRLSAMFHDRLVEKRYQAVVAGSVATETGEVNLPIAADWPNRPLRKINAVLGKPSLTRYRVMGYEKSVRAGVSKHEEPDDSSSLFLCPSILQGERDFELTRVELEPVTGRTHQLRVHMAAIGHPILGDALYGEAASAPRLLLHACSLSFAHPLNGEPLNLVSEAPF